MNQQERDGLREKHQDWSGHCPVCHTETACDVIKVLDATEPECDHLVITDELITDDTYDRNGITYPYCPKCGEKL